MSSYAPAFVITQVPAQRVRPVSLAHPQPHSRPRSVRLTRRGRLVVFVAALLTVFAVGVALGSGSVANDQPGAATTVLQVGPGQTLWEIADEAAGSGSTQEMVGVIRDLNGLQSATVQAGQRLEVPVAD